MLGYSAYEASHPDEAIRHWQLAVVDLPKGELRARLLNNIASEILLKDDADLHTALRLVNEALSFSPAQPDMRETRGQILVRLGRTQEGFDELRAVANQLPNSVGLHKTLSEIYRQMNLSRLADRHAKRVAQLSRERQESPNRLPPAVDQDDSSDQP